MNYDEPTDEEIAAWREARRKRVHSLAASIAAGYIAASRGDWSSDERLASRIADLAELLDDEIEGRFES